jgi:hypothetical protein
MLRKICGGRPETAFRPAREREKLFTGSSASPDIRLRFRNINAFD